MILSINLACRLTALANQVRQRTQADGQRSPKRERFQPPNEGYTTATVAVAVTSWSRRLTNSSAITEPHALTCELQRTRRAASVIASIIPRASAVPLPARSYAVP